MPRLAIGLGVNSVLFTRGIHNSNPEQSHPASSRPDLQLANVLFGTHMIISDLGVTLLPGTSIVILLLSLRVTLSLASWVALPQAFNVECFNRESDLRMPQCMSSSRSDPLSSEPPMHVPVDSSCGALFVLGISCHGSADMGLTPFRGRATRESVCLRFLGCQHSASQLS